MHYTKTNLTCMDLSSRSIFLPSMAVLLFFACCGFLVWRIEAASDYSNLVYKSCANQTHTNHPFESYSRSLSSVFEILTAKSLHSNFFRAGVGDDNSGVWGLFQCRGDLSNANCHNCVSSLPALSESLCGRSLGARVQLSGCYIQYEADEVAENPGPELLYKLCSETEATGIGFEELKSEAFAAAEMEVMSSGNDGFYHESNGEVDIMVQCQRDIFESCDCGLCVSNAVQVAEEECKSSVSGEIYMTKCSLRYTFHPNGIPSTNPHHGPDHNQEQWQQTDTAKTVAIVVGGAAALGFGLFFLKLIKSWIKKDDDL